MSENKQKNHKLKRGHQICPLFQPYFCAPLCIIKLLTSKTSDKHSAHFSDVKFLNP